jgi:hypothetical protein
MKDLHDVISTKEALYPKASTTVAGRTGKIIDLLGYGGVEFVLNYGAVTATNATITPCMKEGSVTGTLTSVADADLLGTELLASLPAQATSRTSGVGMNVTTRIGYKGNKRYVQLNIASSTITAATLIGAVAVLHTPNVAPVANP